MITALKCLVMFNFFWSAVNLYFGNISHAIYFIVLSMAVMMAYQLG